MAQSYLPGVKVNVETKTQGTSVPEDIHICGACKIQFNDVELFILHKREEDCIAHGLSSTAHMCEAQQVQVYQGQSSSLQTESVVQSFTGELEVENVTDQISHDDKSVPTTAPVSSMSDTLAEQLYLSTIVQDTVMHSEKKSNEIANDSYVIIRTSEDPVQVDTTTSAVLQAPDSNALLNAIHLASVESLENDHLKNSDDVDHTLNGVTLHSIPKSKDSTNVTATEPNKDSPIDAKSTIQKVRSNQQSSQTSAVDGERKKFRCEVDDCTFSSAFAKDVIRHGRTHTGERPFICGLCGRAFSRSDKLKIHMRWHAGYKPYKCTECAYSCVDNGSLKKHLRIHTDERPFKCQMCPYASRNSGQLTVHLRTHTGDCPFNCTSCPAKFKIKSDLKRHMRCHTGEKPYKCDICEYASSIKGNLNSHTRLVHCSDQSFACDQCHFSSGTRKALREHQRNHSAMRSVRCPDCEYSCVTRSALRLHAKVHASDKPHRCTSCSYASKHLGNLRTHVRKKHEDAGGRGRAVAGDPERSRGRRLRPRCKKEFACSACGEEFVRYDSLRSHQRHHRETQLSSRRQSAEAAAAAAAASDDGAWEAAQERVASPGVYAANAQVAAQPATSVLSNAIAAAVTDVNVGTNSATTCLGAQVGMSPNVLWMRPGLQGSGGGVTQATRQPHTSRQQLAENAKAYRENHANLATEDNRQNMAAMQTADGFALAQLRPFASAAAAARQQPVMSSGLVGAAGVLATPATYVLQTVGGSGGDAGVPITVELPPEMGGAAAGNTYIQLINESGVVQNVLLPPPPPQQQQQQQQQPQHQNQFVYHFIPPAEPASVAASQCVSLPSATAGQHHTLQPMALYLQLDPGAGVDPTQREAAENELVTKEANHDQNPHKMH